MARVSENPSTAAPATSTGRALRRRAWTGLATLALVVASVSYLRHHWLTSHAIPAPRQLASPTPRADQPCQTREVLLAGGMDAMVGGWAAIVCRNGAFLMLGGGHRARGTLPPRSQDQLLTLLARLPKGTTEYSFGPIQIDGRYFKLMVDEGALRRWYLVDYRQPKSACGPQCQQVLEVSRFLHGLLPVDAQQEALSPWYPRPRDQR
jgi:hypothetical protein